MYIIYRLLYIIYYLSELISSASLWEARVFLPVLKANPRISYSGSQLTRPSSVLSIFA